MDPRRQAALNESHARKVAMREASPHNVQRYAANRGGVARLAHEVDQMERYQAKLEARVAAVAATKPDAKDKPDVSEAEALAVLEAATKPEPKATKPDAKPRG